MRNPAMNLEVDKKIFTWLSEMTVLKNCPAHKQLGNGKVSLDEKTTHHFETGHKFMDILANLQKVKKKVASNSFISNPR